MTDELAKCYDTQERATQEIKDALEAHLKSKEAKDFFDGDAIGEGGHLVGVAVSPCSRGAEKAVIITASGVQEIPAILVSRGVHVTVLIDDENGGRTAHDLHFHKGSVMVKNHVLTPPPIPLACLDIWRD